MLIRGTMDGHTMLAETAAASASLLVKNANVAGVLNQISGYPYLKNSLSVSYNLLNSRFMSKRVHEACADS